MRLVGYLRTSTGGNGDSIPARRTPAESGPLPRDTRSPRRFADEAVSAGLPADERSGLLAAIVDVEEGRADGLVVHRLDRLARELHVQEAALARIWQAGEHTAVYEAVEGEVKRDDPDDSGPSVSATGHGRCRGAGAWANPGEALQGPQTEGAKGGYVGGDRLHSRYGYRLDEGPDGKRAYVTLPEEKEALALMRRIRESGGTLQAICNEWAAQEVEPPSGRAWYPATVRRLLARIDAGELRPEP